MSAVLVPSRHHVATMRGNWIAASTMHPGGGGIRTTAKVIGSRTAARVVFGSSSAWQDRPPGPDG